jgi:uncharacterized repeat protein (TIGR01451 family)
MMQHNPDASDFLCTTEHNARHWIGMERTRRRRAALFIPIIAGAFLLIVFLWLLGHPIALRAATLDVRYVAPSGDDAGNDCADRFHPCASIAHAVTEAATDDEIRVAAGTYVSLTLNKRVTLRGGFTTDNWLEPDPVLNVTTIDAQNAGRPLYVGSGIVAQVSGFHLTGGYVTDVGQPHGGGVLNLGSLTLTDCWIHDNQAMASGSLGGGVSTRAGTLTIRDSYIYSNVAATGGGGLSIQVGSTAGIYDTEIYDNAANSTSSGGGGVEVRTSNVTLENGLIYSNTTEGQGGGLVLDVNSTVSLHNNTLYGNDAAFFGGGAYVYSATLHVQNSIVATNTASSAGGFFGSGDYVLDVTHTDFYDNQPDDGATTGTNNRTDQDPQFVDAPSGDFHLSAGSPAIEGGTAVDAPGADFEGNGRPFGSGIDRGADEYTAPGACHARLDQGRVYTDVQTAVDAASPGSLVQVAGYCAGVQSRGGSLQTVYVDQALTLRGGYTVTDWSAVGYGPTVLDAQDGGRVLYITGTAEIPYRIENLHMVNGNALMGGGVYVGPDVSVELYNDVLSDNGATSSGGGIYNDGGSIDVQHNVIYGNSAQWGGGIYSSGPVILGSSAVVNNTGSSGGGGVYGGGSFTLNTNDFYGNSEDYGTGITPGADDISVAPGFVDPASLDFHLMLSSALVGRADPASPLAADFEGDARPQGTRADIGVDERLFYAEVDLSASPESAYVVTDTATIESTSITFTHSITNLSYTSSPTDSFIIETENSQGWTVSIVDIASPVVLTTGTPVSFKVVVDVPASLPDAIYNETVVTATSQTNGSAYDVEIDIVTSPGIEFYPDYTENADPAEVLTYTHTLVNTGGGEDTFEVFLTSPKGWGTLIEPQPTITTSNTALTSIVLGVGESTTVIARVEVPAFAAAGIQDVMTIQATSSFSEDFFAVVTDTTTVNPTTGDRFVHTGGTNINNNCTQPSYPCETITWAVGQAATEDQVLVAQGTYVESGIYINKSITLRGGYAFDGSNFNIPGGGIDPATTIIDAGGTGRAVRVQVASTLRPMIEGFTIRNGDISGYGGGIYLQAGSSPTLTKLLIENCTGTQGGGIYVESGSPTIIDIHISGASTAGGGGGIYNEDGNPSLHNVTISGSTANQGGAVYSQAGDFVAQGLLLLENNASFGGAVYQAAGTMTISQTQVLSNTAQVGGGFYGGGGTMQLWNNVIYNNMATDGSGGGVYKEVGSLHIINDTIYGNQASEFGGGVFDLASSGSVISNTIFAANAADSGGGLYRSDSSGLAIDFNDFWNNAATSSPDSSIATGSHSVSVDPMFVDAAGGDFHVVFESPIVDIGDPNTFLKTDFEGDIRPINQGYDIGADELAGCLARVINPTTDEQVGPAYGVVQDAVDAAPESYIVQVFGVCRGVQPRLVDGRMISQTVYISKSLTLRGETGAGAPTTLLDAQGMGRVMVVDGPIYVEVSRLILAGGDASGMWGGPSNADAGGGVYNDSDTLDISDSVITDSVAMYGGGFYNAAGTVTFGEDESERTVISANQATYGGGLYLGGGTPIVAHAYVGGNLAEHGGGLYNASSSATVTGTLLVENVATLGGGIYNGSGALYAEELWVEGNVATDGGGLYGADGSEMTLQRSIVLSNTAGSDGGGAYNAAGGDFSLFNTMLAGNVASGDGGGLYNASASLNVRHDTFYENEAGSQGGGIYHDSASTAAVINSSLIVGNLASTGGGIYSAGADPAFDYNDVFGNAIGDYGGNLSVGEGTGNISAGPNFLSTDPASGLFLHIPYGSPAEEAADPDSPLVIDIDGDPRPTNRGFDIGADEVGGCYVRINGHEPTYGNVQVAVGHSAPGDVLHIAGTCLGVSTFSDDGQPVDQTVFLTESLSLRGGYTTTNWTESDPVANPTVLDALGLGRVIYISNSAAISITGLHLRQGAALNGGAIYVSDGVFTMTQSLVYSSTATNGGALYNAAGDVYLVRDNQIFNNEATSGGGVYNADGSMWIDDALLWNNQAATNGGGFYHAGGSGLIQNAVLWANQATGNGGGIYNAATGLTVRHDTFYGNSASNGGGMYTTDASPVVVNTIFSDNTASSGHAIYSAVVYSADYNDAYPTLNAYNGNVVPGANSLSVDPLFADAATGDFHLQEHSPVIDEGDPAMLLFHDFDGDLRPGDQGFDMGADEWRSCYAKITRTGVVYGNIQTAIDNSQPGDEILVTIGTCRGVHAYDDGGTTLYQTVHVTHNLTLLGGYDDAFQDQCEGPYGYPDPICATTFDAEGLGRVVLITNTTAITMERFNIVNGDATGLGGGPGGGDAGGGMYFDGPSASLAHVDFYYNMATYGGALYNAGTGFVMDNSWIRFNTATDGGAIYNDATGVISITPTAQGSRIYSNTATSRGGALFNNGGQALISYNNSEYDLGGIGENQASYGGALFNASGEMHVISNTIEINTALQGGAVYNDAGTILLEDNIIVGNRATSGSGAGGGCFNNGGVATLDLGNRFAENDAGGSGGAIFVAGGDVDIWNQLIYDNQAVNQGGGIYVAAGSSPSVLHNTLYQNNLTGGTSQGGGMFVASGANPTIKNTIFVSNTTPGQGSAVYALGGTLDYNDYYNNSVAGTVGGGANSISVDPLFVSAGSADFHLLPESPMIDQAQDGLGVLNDFEGNPRPVNAGPDIGADEVNDCLALVRSSGIIYGRIQTALDNATSGDTIWVAAGVCEETVTIDDEVTIVGSYEKDFSGQVEGWDGEPYVATFIDAMETGRVMTVQGTVQTVNLSWLGLINGDVTSNDGGGLWTAADQFRLADSEVFSNTAANGGGIYVDSGTATFDEVLVELNEALSGHGGGIYSSSGTTVTVLSGAIAGNIAQVNGGGMYNASGSHVEVDGGHPIELNQAGASGGGVYNNSATFELSNKRLTYNQALSGNGGGIYAANSQMSLVNLGLYANTASGSGGGMYRTGGNADVYHATVWENVASSQGGGVYNATSSMVISASIVSSNTAAVGTGIYGAANVGVHYSLLWPDTSYAGAVTLAEGNLFGDPHIRNSWGALLFDSPAIDAVPHAESSVLVDAMLDPRVNTEGLLDQGLSMMCAKDMGRDEFWVRRNLSVYGPTLDELVVAPGEAYTYTISLNNASENVSGVMLDQPTSYGPGSGYTETVLITLNTSQDWARIVDVLDVANLTIQPGGKLAMFDIGPGHTAEVQVRSAVPLGTFAGVEDVVTLDYEARHCLSEEPITGSSGTVTTIAGEYYAFDIGPDNFGAAMPGQTVTYTHVITNLGNITDTYTIYPRTEYYASGEVASPLPPALTLTPGQTGTVVISVTINLEAAGGLVDIANAVARSSGSGSERAASDNTTIGYIAGTRYVDVNGGLDSLVDETLGDPGATDYPDNNCTQPGVAACRTIQHALGQALDGDEIRIAQGVYTDVLAIDHGQTTTQTAYVDQSVVLRGGYAPPAWDQDPPNHITHTTFLDPQGQGRAIYVTSGVTVTVDRLVLRDGDATDLGGGPGGEDAGGLLYSEDSTVTLTANRFYDGLADLGGGFYSGGGDLLVQNNLLHDNGAVDQGGAVYVYSGTAMLENNTFFRNTATSGEGGAVYVANGSLEGTNNIVAGHSSNSGGALYGAPSVTVPSFTYNLYYGNTGGDTGGTVPAPALHDVQADPQFVAPGAAPPDLYIAGTSPARDTGNPASMLDIDYANNLRPLGPQIDIGAYERVPRRELLFYSDQMTSTLPGETIVFTHTLENTGEMTDTFTFGYTDDYGWTVTIDPPSAELVPYDSATVTVTVHVPGDAGRLTNNVRVSATSSPPETTVTVVDTIYVRGPVWEISKAADPYPLVDAGEHLTYTLTVVNNGDAASAGVYTITDPLPTNTHYVSATPAPDSTGPVVTWVLSDTIDIGESFDVILVVGVDSPLEDGTEIVNQEYAIVGGGTAQTATGTPVTVIAASASALSVSKTASAGPVSPGDWLTYTVTVENATGASSPALGVVITDTLPGNVVYGSAGFVAPASGTVDDSALPQVVWTLDGEIPVGGLAQVTVTVRVNSPLEDGTILANRCDAAAVNALAPAFDELDIIVNATNAITLSKTVEPAIVASGGVVTYTVTLTNSGDGVAQIALNDLLADGFDPATYTTNVTLDGHGWDTTENVTTIAFTATAPAAAGIYANQRVTAAYDATQAVIANVAPVEVVEPIQGLSLINDSPTIFGNATTLTATISGGTDVNYVLSLGYPGVALQSGTLTPGVPETINYTYPATGTFTAVITATNDIDEVWTQSIVYVVDELLPDIVITDMTVSPASPAADEPITVTVTVHNQGFITTTNEYGTAWFYVEIYAKLSGDAPTDPGDHEGGTDPARWEFQMTSAGLAPGQYDTLTYHIVLTDTTIYTFYAQADVTWWGQPLGLVPEWDETNNIYTYGPVDVVSGDQFIYLPLVLKEN